MVQLVEIGRTDQSREETEESNRPNPAAMMSSLSLAFWLWDSADLSEYAASLEWEAKASGLEKV